MTAKAVHGTKPKAETILTAQIQKVVVTFAPRLATRLFATKVKKWLNFLLQFAFTWRLSTLANGLHCVRLTNQRGEKSPFGLPKSTENRLIDLQPP
jgi:hypothetical protein